MGGVILQGLLGGSMILQGFTPPAPEPDHSHVIFQGFGGGSIVTQGYGGAYVPPPEAPAKYRDSDILLEIVRLLESTNQFGSVWLGEQDAKQRVGAEDASAAYVVPETWSEITDGDDQDGPRTRRVVTYTLAIFVRDDNTTRRIQRLDQLANVAANTLNGVSYLGETVAPWSRLTNGRYSDILHPAQYMDITGTFTILLDGDDGRDVADNLDVFL
jgi:hypothetical protein